MSKIFKIIDESGEGRLSRDEVKESYKKFLDGFEISEEDLD